MCQVFYLRGFGNSWIQEDVSDPSEYRRGLLSVRHCITALSIASVTCGGYCEYVMEGVRLPEDPREYMGMVRKRASICLREPLERLLPKELDPRLHREDGE